MNHFVSIIAIALAPLQAPDVSDSNYSSLKSMLSPPAEEFAWRQIPWRPTLWEAVLDARRDDKPILLWAMNGHPLGCT